LAVFVFSISPAVSGTLVANRGGGAADGGGGKAGALRGNGKQPTGGPLDTISRHYFGLTFDDGPFGQNPYAVYKSARVVDDLDPTAPYDRVDRTWVPTLSGSQSAQPGTEAQDVPPAQYGGARPDYVPPYLHPRPFPEEYPPKQKHDVIIPLKDKEVIAHIDRLRFKDFDENLFNPLGMYPLTAPADKINNGPYPVAGLDKVPKLYDRYFDQSYQREAERQTAKMLNKQFKQVSGNDTAISHAEYDNELQGRQGKTPEQADNLWNEYHIAEIDDMTKNEFMNLAKTGFDLGKDFLARQDLSAILKPPQAANMGYWGGGKACPTGTYITGAAIKVMPTSDTADNTGLNGVKFKCGDGSEIKTVEGPDGAWTDWAECPAGQKAHSVSIRIKAYTIGQDNSGINDLMFKCRSEAGDQHSTLMFGTKVPQQDQTGYVFVNGAYIPKSQTTVDDEAFIVGNGTPGTEGGWSQELLCGVNGALCGGQGRLFHSEAAVAPVTAMLQVDSHASRGNHSHASRGNLDQDNMGITDFRFYCCSADMDCSAPCAADAGGEKCLSCQSQAMKVVTR
jgi:hypothetical protein